MDRLAEVWWAVLDDKGRARTKLHGLRMLNPAITSRVPLASADSTNVARNIKYDKRWTGTYMPVNREARADVLVGRIESVDTPASFDWQWNGDLFGGLDDSDGVQFFGPQRRAEGG